MLYSHEIPKLYRVSVWDCVSDFRCTFKTRSRFWRLPGWTANFYWPHILKGKADGMHLKNHLLRRRRFSRFSDGIWRETWFGKWWNCIAPLSCYFESSGVYTETTHLKKTHCRIESVLSLAWFFFFKEESTWRVTRKNCFFFFLSPVSTAGRKFSPTLLITSDKIKDLDVCRFCFSIASTWEPHQGLNIVCKSRSA